MARQDPYRNFRFRVEIDGVQAAAFSEVTIAATTTDVIEYREGGDLAWVRKLPGRHRFGNVTLKRGLTQSAELWAWHKQVLDGNPGMRKRVVIVVLDETGNDQVRFVVDDAWPVKYEIGALVAKGTDVAIETLELANEGVERVTMSIAARDARSLPLGNMHFRVEVEGLAESRAFEVVFPEARIARARGVARVTYGPLLVRRALTRSREWYDWWDAARREAKAPLRAVRVVSTDAAGRDAVAWRFAGAVPVAYLLSPLQALGEAPVIESLELAVADFGLDETEAVTRAPRGKMRRRR